MIPATLPMCLSRSPVSDHKLRSNEQQVETPESRLAHLTEEPPFHTELVAKSEYFTGVQKVLIPKQFQTNELLRRQQFVAQHYIQQE